MSSYLLRIPGNPGRSFVCCSGSLFLPSLPSIDPQDPHRPEKPRVKDLEREADQSPQEDQHIHRIPANQPGGTDPDPGAWIWSYPGQEPTAHWNQEGRSQKIQAKRNHEHSDQKERTESNVRYLGQTFLSMLSDESSPLGMPTPSAHSVANTARMTTSRIQKRLCVLPSFVEGRTSTSTVGKTLFGNRKSVNVLLGFSIVTGRAGAGCRTPAPCGVREEILKVF